MSTPTYAFLTDEWIEAAHALRDEYADRLGTPPVEARVNVIVKESPHHEGSLEGHIDSSAGALIIDRGHLDEPDLTVTVDYATAQAAFVERNPQVVMQAFMSGKILVVGDVSKLVALQSETPDPTAIEMYQRLDAMTARE